VATPKTVCLMALGTLLASAGDGGADKLRMLRDRQLGERHPLDVGADAVARYFRIEDERAQAQRLRVMAEPDRGG
jgi:hypothetical protein